MTASLKLDQENEPTISLMKVHKSSGRFSGLSLRITQLFSTHADWMEARLVLKNLSFGRYQVKDIYWKQIVDERGLPILYYGAVYTALKKSM